MIIMMIDKLNRTIAISVLAGKSARNGLRS
jgi:hypothetical protein